MSAGQSVIIGEIVLQKSNQLGVANFDGTTAKGGPYAQLFAGSTDFAVGDTFTVPMTNNNEGGFVRGVDRMYGAYEKGVRLKTAASPSIPDSLIS